MNSIYRTLIPIFFLFSSWHHSPATELEILGDDKTALLARIELIEQAEKTLCIAWFELSDDEVGQRLTKTIAQASSRGVDVRLIIDAMHDHASTAQRQHLLDSGVQIRWFHPLGTGAGNLMKRMHDKYLSADNQKLILGSRNIANVYFGLSTDQKNFNDIDIKVTGDFVRHTSQYFNQLWGSKEVAEQRRYKKVARLQKDSDRPFSTVLLHEHEEHTPSSPVTHSIENDRLVFLHDANGQKSQADGIHQQLYDVIRAAQTSIILVSPYFYPTTELITVLTQAKKRGVNIRVLTNSIQSSNRPINQVALGSLMRGRLKHVPIQQYEGAGTLHTKGIVIDGKVACVTSYNFNHRSQYFDTELALIVQDEAFAQSLMALFEEYFETSRPLAPLTSLKVSETAISMKRLRQFRWLVRVIPRHL